jgi:hypothetical protein
MNKAHWANLGIQQRHTSLNLISTILYPLLSQDNKTDSNSILLHQHVSKTEKKEKRLL